MDWFIKDDTADGVITAAGHIASSHGTSDAPALPGVCVLFELGAGLRHLQATYPARVLIPHLPGFISDGPCLAVEGMEGVCFVNGGYGAPTAVDSVETLAALGVHTLVLVGMCGGFSPRVRVGDVVIPHKIKSEEGASWHYVEQPEYARPDEGLHALALQHFSHGFPVHADATVTTDAVYRQTFLKEALWREAGCVGVDMEASAVLTVCRVRGLRAAALLIVSDMHPQTPSDPAWAWGDPQFKEKRAAFLDGAIALAATLPKK